MEVSEIPPIPELPQEIIRAIDQQKLVVFLGAGVSRLVGCDGWDQLARRLVRRCHEEWRLINYREYETLVAEKDHKKTITICYNLLKKECREREFFDVFDQALVGKPELLSADNIYKQLAKWPATFITTNADVLFDASFVQDRIYYRIEQFVESNLKPRILFHIHGTRDDRSSLVFTVDRYVERYNDPPFKDFLQSIFNQDRVVLFMGYGMSEFELLDYVIGTKGRTHSGATQRSAQQHFILLPYYKDETNIMKMDQMYYKHLDIKVEGYAKDKWGYRQLYHVIEKWNVEQLARTNVVPRDFGRIDRFLEDL